MKRSLQMLMTLVALFGLIGGGGYLWFDHHMRTPRTDSATAVELVVERGTTYDRLATLLLYHGLISDPTLFDLRARQRGRRAPLKAGVYKLSGTMSPDELMDVIARGPHSPLDKVPLKFQIIEGENIWQVAAKLRDVGVQGDLLTLDESPRRVESLQVGAPIRLPEGAHTRLEGYLFPETYHLDRKRPNLTSAVRQATRQFRRVWMDVKKEHASRYAKLMRRYDFSDHDFITLASLVEKEVAALEEAPMVAAVFYNRLDIGRKLQTDPTMVYGPHTWRERPSPTFRRSPKNRYNTYQYKGLPPGPICNPGRRALEAVLNPAATEALYFVARRDGTGRHAFARTLVEHRANIEKYLKR